MKLSTMVLFMCLVFLSVFGMSDVGAENQSGSITMSPLVGGYLFEGDQDLKHRPSYGIGLGYNFNEHCSAEAVFNYVDSDSRADGINDQGDVDALLYRLDGLYHFMPANKFVPYIAIGAGVMTLDAAMGGDHIDNDFIADYGAGIKYFLNDVIALRADVRHIMTFPENNLLYTAGLTFQLGGKKKAPPAEMPKDSDRDGIYDDMDKCPGTPAGVKVDMSGCPIDSDKDGVYDYKDKCPGTPIGVKVNDSGCPLDIDKDSDKDGVYDAMDKCPGTLAGVKVDQVGCPLDSDKDGVYDYLDKCPKTPVGAKVDARGCWVLKDVVFDTAKWDIKSQSFNSLDEAVNVLKKNPSLHVEIQGHTDNRGAQKYNQMLSEKRAHAVMGYLMEKGVSKDRLTSEGYGFAKPAATNETPEGRAQNRRVQLRPIY